MVVLSVQFELEAQDLAADMRRVISTYAALDHFTVEFKTYTFGRNDDLEVITFKKCGQNYFTSGYGQITCVNDEKQIMLIPEQKIAVYSTLDSDAKMVDPIVGISSIVNSATRIDLLEATSSLHKYRVFLSSQEFKGTEIWIETTNWYVKRIEQYIGSSEEKVVYEMTKFRKSCDADAAVNLNRYCTMVHGKAKLTPQYQGYQLVNANDFLVRQ